MKTLNEKAFTLIELLIVIAIIGVLVTIVVVAINPVKLINDSRDGKIRSDMQQLKASLQLYYNDCKTYPPTDTFENTLTPKAGEQWKGDFENDACSPPSTIYMRQVPIIPGVAYTKVSASSYLLTGDLSSDHTNRSEEDNKTLDKCGNITHNNDAIDYAVCND